MSAAEMHAALAEVVRRATEIAAGQRVVGGLRACAVDVALPAARALGVTLPVPDEVQKTWTPPEQAQRARRASK
jgi:hypothetical protein